MSLGGFTLQNYVDAWQQADFTQHFLNSVYHHRAGGAADAVPRLVRGVRARPVQLLVQPAAARSLHRRQPAAAAGAARSRCSGCYRAIPLPFWISDSGTLLNSYWALILINIAFQTGFCTFVLSNYMKTLPKELYEAAQVDGASVLRQFFQLTLPLCRPPLAALATLQVTWIYNEFFWATVLHAAGRQVPDHAAR